jgi:hypothetical protein
MKAFLLRPSSLFLLLAFLMFYFGHSWMPTIPITRGIQLKTAPLIGGPSWLPIHVKVVVGNSHTFDYVPLNATSPSTLKSLIGFHAVPAQARVQVLQSFDAPPPSSSIGDDYSVERAKEFCEDYSKDLHIVTNNCWTFAFELIKYIIRGREREAKAAP